jgi:hypothetical protein
MTSLEKKALGVLPLSSAEVHRMAADARKHPLSDRAADITRLCASHERLRAELEGATILLADKEGHFVQMGQEILKQDTRYAGEPNPHRAAA